MKYSGRCYFLTGLFISLYLDHIQLSAYHFIAILIEDVGPFARRVIVALMEYGDASRFCIEDLEKELIRCEEKWL